METQDNTMTYKFNRDGILEDVMKENWCWEARYDNGKVLKQFDDDGNFHQFKEIDQSELAVFKMVSDGKAPFTLLFNPQRMKLIHFYKRVRLNMGASDETFITAYCFGYETKTFNRTNKTNLMIMPSGEVIITEDTNLIDFK